MIPAKKNIIFRSLAVFGLLLLAWILGNLYDGRLYSVRKILGPLQTVCYILVIGIWANTIRWRIIQPYIRICLHTICLVMILWLSLRSIKFFYAVNEDFVRYLWYSYYIGILLIPMFAFLAAVSIGKSDDFKLTKGYYVMIGFTLLLVVMALTNDLHQFVFSFPEDAPVWNDSVHSYNWGYWIIAGWCSACLVSSLVLMLGKSRRQNKAIFRWMPFFPLLLLSIYLVAYGVYNVRFLFDLTVMFCLFYIMEFEFCIQCGLIRSNTGYTVLFENGSYGAQIVDRDCNILQSSDTAYELTIDRRKAALSEIIWPEENIRIRSHPIKNGYVLWKEDVTELNTLLEQLRDNNESIEASVAIEQESYETRRKISSLQEKNRLYDLLQSQTAGQIDKMDSLLAEYEETEELSKKQAILAKLTVIGSYIKRRGNLLFISEKSRTIDSGELALCLEESFAGLRLCGVECGLDMERGHLLEADRVFEIYDRFEEIVERTMDECGSFWIKAMFTDNPRISLWVECDRDLSCDFGWGEAVKEDGLWHFSLPFEMAEEKGGGTV